jgi:uncharacterized membrane protein YbhN (UPF0104 family)
MNKKNLISYALVVVLLFVIFKYLLTKDYIALLHNISFYNMLVALFIVLIIYVISGIQYAYIISSYSQKKLLLLDICSLPIAMNLWSYIIPAKGGFFYATALLKFKYKLKIVEGLAISVYISLISLFLTGLIGLYFVIINRIMFSIISLLSVLLLLSPLFTVILNMGLKNIHPRENSYLTKLQDIAGNAVNNINELWKDLPLFIVVLLINILHIFASIALYYWANVIFNLSLPLLSIVMLTLVMRLSIIFRFTPGNLGVEQLVSGGVVVILGGKMSDGILMSIFVALTTMIISFSLGSLYTLGNMKYFNARNFHSLIQSLKSEITVLAD